MIPQQAKPETFEERKARLDAMFSRSYPSPSRARAPKPVEPVPVPGSEWQVEPWDLEEALSLRRGGVAVRYLSWRYNKPEAWIAERLKMFSVKG